MIEAAFAPLTIPITAIDEAAAVRAQRVRRPIEGARDAAAAAHDAERDEHEDGERRHDPADDAERSPTRSDDEAGGKIGVEPGGGENGGGGAERGLAELVGGRERVADVHGLRLRGASAGPAPGRGYNPASSPLSSAGRAPPW